MNSIRQIAVAAALAAAASSGFAAVEQNLFFLPPEFGPGLTQYFTFDNGAALGVTRTAGDTFVDDFLFNAPPPASTVDFTALLDTSTLPNPQIAFTGFSIFGFAPGSMPVSFANSVSTMSFVSGSGAQLDSGLYDLEITGTILADGATYSGMVEATAVPEPEALLLMLAGLGGLAAVARRR